MAEAVSIDGLGELLQGVFAREEGPRLLLAALAQAAMRAEAEAHVGAAPHERSEQRRGRRNGTKPPHAEDPGRGVGTGRAAGAGVRAVPPGPVQQVAAERAGAAGRVRRDVLPGRQHPQRAGGPGGNVRRRGLGDDRQPGRPGAGREAGVVPLSPPGPHGLAVPDAGRQVREGPRRGEGGQPGGAGGGWGSTPAAGGRCWTGGCATARASRRGARCSAR